MAKIPTRKDYERAIVRDISMIAFDIETSLKRMSYFKDLKISYDKHNQELLILSRRHKSNSDDQLRLKVCGAQEFENSYNGSISSSLASGFLKRASCINDDYVDEAFVKESNLEQVLETVGHELGHSMMPESWSGKPSEEAKAYAFQHLFCLNLPAPFYSMFPRKCSRPTHQAAYDFVAWELILGKTPEEIIEEVMQTSIPFFSGPILFNRELYIVGDKK